MIFIYNPILGAKIIRIVRVACINTKGGSQYNCNDHREECDGHFSEVHSFEMVK